MQSSLLQCHSSFSVSMFDQMELCVCTTPFGLDVVPYFVVPCSRLHVRQNEMCMNLTEV